MLPSSSYAQVRRVGCTAPLNTHFRTCTPLFRRLHAPFFSSHKTKQIKISASLGSNGNATNSTPSPFTNAARNAAKEATGLQSETLDPDHRRKAISAISAAPQRAVTVGDVAAAAGLTLAQAETALKALAHDTLATLSVSPAGEILFSFPPRFQSAIESKSLLLKTEAFFATAGALGSYLMRVTYGTALVVSIAIAVTALIVLVTAASSSSSSKDDKRSSSSPFSISFPGRIAYDLSEYFFFYNPYYHPRRASYYQPLNFTEAIFSFVFGDGDPNVDRDEERWKAVGAYISGRNGVVTAEELMPFVDGLTLKNTSGSGSGVVDESYVLPVLTRLGGSPEVDAQGRILYRFPAIQSTGSSSTAPSRRVMDMYAEALEKPWQLTAIQGQQWITVVLLGVANAVGIAWLTSALLFNPTNMAILARNGLGWVVHTLPALQMYAAAFFVVPAVRWVLYRRRNAEIEQRNALKERALQLVFMNPSPELKDKMDSATRAAGEQKRVLTREASVYRSDRAVEEQPIDIELDVFDRKLQRSSARIDQRQQQQKQ